MEGISAPTDPPAGPRRGWAADSLDRALRSTVLLIALVWNLLLVPAVFSLGYGGSAASAVLATGHLVVAGALVLSLGARLPPAVPVIGQIVLVGVGWATAEQADGAAALATAWTWDFSMIAAAFLLGRLGIVACLVSPVVMSAIAALGHPTWPVAVVIAIGVTPLAILVVVRLALRALNGFAVRLDQTTAEAENARTLMLAGTAAQRATSENARTLHDTAVNTLGAIASGGAAIRDEAVVRDRCAHDAAVLETVISGQEGDASSRWSLPDDARGGPVEVVRTGLTDDDLEYVAATVPLPTRLAVGRACGELVQNSARHSGADTVHIDAGVDPEHLVIVVSDAGRGFDGTLPEGRGLAESVLGRLRDVRVAVEIATAPGQGTRVTLRCPLVDEGVETLEGADREPGGIQATVDALRRRAGLSWGFGVVAVGVLLRIADDPFRSTATWAMLAVAALVALLVLVVPRSVRTARVLVVVVLAAVPTTFVLGYAGVGFGHGDLAVWQALGPSIPLVLILVISRRLVDFLLGVALLVAAGVATAIAVAAEGTGASVTAVLVGMAVPVVIAAGWFVFYRGLAAIARRAEAEEREEQQLRRERATREAVEASRLRWTTAGLNGAVSVLTRIARGAASPADPVVQRLCDREESYMRQLIQLSPTAIHLGVWFAALLREGHEREVDVVIRAGDLDVDGSAATALGEALLAMVRSAAAGSSFVVGSFVHDGRVLVTVVGPADDVGLRAADPGLERLWSLHREQFGAQGMVELSPRGSDSSGTLI